jgi:hypothetical protein
MSQSPSPPFYHEVRHVVPVDARPDFLGEDHVCLASTAALSELLQAVAGPLWHDHEINAAHVLKRIAKNFHGGVAHASLLFLDDTRVMGLEWGCCFVLSENQQKQLGPV